MFDTGLAEFRQLWAVKLETLIKSEHIKHNHQYRKLSAAERGVSWSCKSEGRVEGANVQTEVDSQNTQRPPGENQTQRRLRWVQEPLWN